MERQTPALTWTGRVLSALPVLMLVFSSSMKLSGSAEMLEGWTKYGFPPGTLQPVGVVELSCVVLYLVPQTAVFGAILMAAYLGGATCTHIRAGENFVAPFAVAMIAWAGLALREPRLRALLPLRRA